MSSVNFLEKLLDGADVEWMPLGEVLVRTKGTQITAAKMKQLHKDGAPLKVLVLPGFPWVAPVRNWPGRGPDHHRRSRWLS